MVRDVVAALVRDFGSTLLSGPEVLPLPHDVDLHASPGRRREVANFLTEQGFVCVEKPGACHARIFEGGKCYFVDVTFDAQHFAHLFPGVRLSNQLKEEMRSNGDLESFVKHTFSLNGEARTLARIMERFPEFYGRISDPRYVAHSPFRMSVPASAFRGAMRKHPLDLVRALTVPGLARLALGSFRIRQEAFGTGSIVAVVGPDGAGKSTVVDALASALFSPKRYMGDWGFALQPFYNLLYRQHIAVARMVYPFQYIENWIRYLKAFLLKMAGKTVVVDRYPGFNRNLRSDRSLLRIIDALYSFFPRADRYLFISAPPEAVYARRQELSPAEIETTQRNIRARLRRLPHREIVNTDLDRCLNEALRYVLGAER